MALAHLTVRNYRSSEAPPPAAAAPQACVIRTCLREVQVSTAPTGAEGAQTGAAAYEFLLRLASGLESEIAGETEIFGQIKQAWREHEQAQAEQARALRPFMQRLLQDTKEIRSEYVVGLGSATYGSLARRLLGGRPEGTTLLIGAGQLAATVLPYLDCPDLRIYNRNPVRVFAMLAEARERPGGSVTVLEPSLEAELAAWREAHDVVLCVPADPSRDAQRVRAWQESAAQRGGRVLHLGLHGASGTVWEGLPQLATLQELFGLRDTQAEQRAALLARARRACLDKAKLAYIDDADGSRPGTSNHGWEDLAVFQLPGL